MKIFKFGGASVNSAERVRQAAVIIRQWTDEKLVVVISAMGKVTNALEKVTGAFYAGKKEEALQLFDEIKQQHVTIAKQLLTTGYSACEEQLKYVFTEAEWLLHDKPVRGYDYYYDQIVCTGELLSTTIISAYLNETGIRNRRVDIRDIFRTDNTFRDAAIDWEFTYSKVQQSIVPLFQQTNIVITQGFIGATDENESTTLGREGSDYTAAVFANMLDAESQTIWKDVESVMNADPRQFPDAAPIAELSYAEVIEMAYYGAQVIHPKTIKPLQNKSIPLYVKCFLDASLPGTVIHNKPVHRLPPLIVLKEKQVLIKVSSRDFSFIGEHHIENIYRLFEQLHIKPNLTQNAAISFLCVLDDHAGKIESLASEASVFLEVQVTKNLSLLTIRHYTKETVEKLTAGKNVLLRQQTPETIQFLLY